MPQGALTLRVFTGDNCSGELYQDDGKSFAFQKGVYLRMKFSCQVTAEGLRLKIGSHEGSYPAWWKQVQVEIYGFTPKSTGIYINGKETSANRVEVHEPLGFVLEDDGKGEVVDIK
jgi:alpha-glucosidase